MNNKFSSRLFSISLALLVTILALGDNLYAQSRLYNAVASDNVSQATRFLKRGDNPNGDGNPNYIPLLGATELNIFRMVQLLVSNRADINIQNHIGFTALMEAALQQNHRIILYLIANGANIELRANNGATALMVAVSEGNVRAARTLLEKGANPNVFDAKGLTPLMRAVAIGDNIDLIRVLVEFKADMNATDPEGNPVFMVNPYRNRVAAHRELLILGANPNIQNSKGETPIIKAVLEGNIEMVRLLVERGADRFKKDNSGASAVDYAITQFEINQYFNSLR